MQLPVNIVSQKWSATVTVLVFSWFCQTKTSVVHMHQQPAEELDSRHQQQCGYQNCNLGKPDMLNVHLIPHTHDDVGWLKTVDQYYYGANNTIQKASVQYILDTVISELRNDPNKRFIYVEIAFFARWWAEQTDSLRHIVKGLVNDGRLEFILGGWCMNDEASTHYNAMIDQHTLGFQFISHNFGECGRPRIGWQIDPFGHSREQASMFAQFGFDSLFFGRLDYQDKANREKTGTMEVLWQGSANLGDQASLFTHVNYNGYSSPPTFEFDVLTADPPIMDDHRLHDYNVDERVNTFLEYCRNQSKAYTSNHIMITMGGDFQYSNAHQNFKNMDKLIHHVNARQANGSKVNLLYSTPSCYTYAVNQANLTYIVKDDDFFPYASKPHTFWTGYFTSRSTLKGYVRLTNNFLQVCQQLDVLSLLGTEHSTMLKIDALRKALGVAQHHDAVSGTEKQHVAYDYAMRLQAGISQCQDVVNMAYGKLLARSNVDPPSQEFCQLVNISACSTSEHLKQLSVVVYNPLGRAVTSWVQIPVSGSTYTVTSSELQPAQAQLVPVSTRTKAIPERAGSAATNDLIFQATLPPLGFSTYFVQESTDAGTAPSSSSINEWSVSNKPFSIENKHLLLKFDSHGLLSFVSHKRNGMNITVTQKLMYYKAFYGNGSTDDLQPSGAYIFRPNGSQPVEFADPSVKVFKGNLVQEIHQEFSPWATQVIRLYKDALYVEVEWTVGPIPIGDHIGREVISRFESDLNSNGTYYTDSNGREILQRRRDWRATWDLDQTEPIAGNYYPVNSKIFIKDEQVGAQLTVLTDRSLGGGSIADGQIELMLHRRTLRDDGYGVGEPLNETGADGRGLVARGKQYVVLSDIQSAPKLHRHMAEELFMAPLVSLAALSVTPAQYNSTFVSKWSSLASKELPANVHLLTLQQWDSGSVLLRLEHFFEAEEDAQLSAPANVTLKGFFKPLQINSVKELTLGANQALSDSQRLQWNRKNGIPVQQRSSTYVKPVNPSDFTVTLKPMQIRTFQVFLHDMGSKLNYNHL